MRIVILGASGQLGKLFFQHIKAEFPNAEVIGTSRKGGANLLTFDPFSSNWSVLGETDVLINAIGQIKESREFSFEKIHVGISQLMLDNRTLIGNPYLIQISALGADNNHKTEFLRTKGLADNLLSSAGHTLVVRPSIVCTEDTMLLRKMRTLVKISGFTFRKVFCPKGFPETRIQPILGEDLAELLVRLVKDRSRTGILEVGGPQAIPFREILDWVASGQQTDVKLVEMPREFFDTFVRYVISAWFPSLLNYDQYRLLFEDNVVGEFMGRLPEGFEAKSTEEFWRKG